MSVEPRQPMQSLIKGGKNTFPPQAVGWLCLLGCARGWREYEKVSTGNGPWRCVIPKAYKGQPGLAWTLLGKSGLWLGILQWHLKWAETILYASFLTPSWTRIKVHGTGNYAFNNSDVPIFRRRLMLRNHGDIILSWVTGTELSLGF